jgi:hypothetical protein
VRGHPASPNHNTIPQGGIMDKESVSSITDERQAPEKEYLSNILFELHQIEKDIDECDMKEVDPDYPVLRLLISTTIKKIEYYEEKYGFKIDADDVFYIQDAFEFFRKAEEVQP